MSKLQVLGLRPWRNCALTAQRQSYMSQLRRLRRETSCEETLVSASPRVEIQKIAKTKGDITHVWKKNTALSIKFCMLIHRSKTPMSQSHAIELISFPENYLSTLKLHSNANRKELDIYCWALLWNWKCYIMGIWCSDKDRERGREGEEREGVCPTNIPDIPGEVSLQVV